MEPLDVTDLSDWSMNDESVLLCISLRLAAI
jgi:hypothetical protein